MVTAQQGCRPFGSIFAGIATPEQSFLVVDFFESGVMAGRNVLGSHAVGVVEQLAKLDPVVALHARVRRAAGIVLLEELLEENFTRMYVL